MVTFVTTSGDTWSPYVYGAPADFLTGCNQGRITKPFAGMCAIVSVVSSATNNVELFWNGSSLVPFTSIGFPSPGPWAVTPPAGALTGTQGTFDSWTVTVPAATIGAGFYRIRFYRDQGDGYGYFFGNEWYKVTQSVTGSPSPNPAGVTVDSNFGGTDALRLERADGTGIAGATITATVTPAGNNIVFTRAVATSASDGRWAFPVVLQPNTLHQLRVTDAGFQDGTMQITTGAA